MCMLLKRTPLLKEALHYLSTLLCWGLNPGFPLTKLVFHPFQPSPPPLKLNFTLTQAKPVFYC